MSAPSTQELHARARAIADLLPGFVYDADESANADGDLHWHAVIAAQSGTHAQVAISHQCVQGKDRLVARVYVPYRLPDGTRHYARDEAKVQATFAWDRPDAVIARAILRTLVPHAVKAGAEYAAACERRAIETNAFRANVKALEKHVQYYAGRDDDTERPFLFPASGDGYHYGKVTDAGVRFDRLDVTVEQALAIVALIKAV